MIPSTNQLPRRTVLRGIGVTMAWSVVNVIAPAVAAPGAAQPLPGTGFFYAGNGIFLPNEYRSRLVALGLVRVPQDACREETT